ncbi:type II secretion system protein [Effusibacillus consociatus]|uniref:Type II secretion system protein n=1 Tax=Effusibacillus consociatus TaxID=1117041 RepID=A0ABV9Q4P4_9BACL
MNEEGFSLLESVTAILILSTAIAVTLPIWGMIQSQARLAAKINGASHIAINEMEQAVAGMVRTGIWSVREGGQSYTVHTQSIEEMEGQHIRVRVAFQERGKEYAVSYETLVQ